jgi:hypothetical protein
LRLGTILLCLFIGIHTAHAKSGRAEIRLYIFGNSLIHHLTPSDETTVPHWLHLLAEVDGRQFAVDGQWGFLRDFAKNLPPTDQWSFKQAKSAWNRDTMPFAKAGFNTIMVNPANFIQYQAADRPDDGDNPEKQSPLGATLTLFDWLGGQQKGQTYYIYEGWADMEKFSRSFPPNEKTMKAYHAYNMGAYHEWYVDYRNRVSKERPQLDVRLVPVASTLSRLFTETPLRDLKPADLYSDNAPHGTANTYFLAAVITYSALYGEKAPKNFVPPDSLHPLIKQHYSEISDLACQAVAQHTSCQTEAGQ